jgi:hypothetical protein
MLGSAVRLQAGQDTDVVVTAAGGRRLAASRGDDRFATARRSEREDLGGQQEASRKAENSVTQVHFQKLLELKRKTSRG